MMSSCLTVFEKCLLLGAAVGRKLGSQTGQVLPPPPPLSPSQPTANRRWP